MRDSWHKNVNITRKSHCIHTQINTSRKIKSHEKQHTHPKRLRNQKVLIHMPTKGHLQKTSTIPPRKQMVPWGFCFRVQKYNVFCGPMMSVRPRTKRIYMHSKGESGEHAHTVAKAHMFLSTRSGPSKKNMTPRSMNSTLNEVSETMAHLRLGQTCVLRGRM